MDILRNLFGNLTSGLIRLLVTVGILAAAYFFIVKPYTVAKEKYFPSPEPGTPEDVLLLQEIRDLLAAQQGGTTPPTSSLPG